MATVLGSMEYPLVMTGGELGAEHKNMKILLGTIIHLPSSGVVIKYSCVKGPSPMLVSAATIQEYVVNGVKPVTSKNSSLVV